MTAAPAHSQSVPRRAAVDSGTVYISGGISGFQGLGFSLLILYLFLIFSRIFDVKLAFLHIPGISYRVIFAMVILSQAFLKALHSDVGKALLVFTVCFVLAVPTSLWKGGSTQQTVRALGTVAGSGSISVHSDLILSGASNTQIFTPAVEVT